MYNILGLNEEGGEKGGILVLTNAIKVTGRS